VSQEPDRDPVILSLSKDVARGTHGLTRGFAQFLLRGKTADLAVGVVVGAAIGSLTNAFVGDVLTPLFGAIFGSTTPFKDRVVHLGAETIAYGQFLNALISFLLVCAVVYFAIIVPMNAATTNAFFQPPPDPAMRKCPECASDIPVIAKRCMYCTQPVEPRV
jgi:large conductance mechanosensitive channel